MLGIICVSLFVIMAVTLINTIFRHRGYWKRRGVNGPKPELFLGNLRSMINCSYPYIFQLRDWTRQYGPCYGIQEGWDNALVISDPNLLQEVFVRKFDCFTARKQFPLQKDVDTDEDVHVFDAKGARWKRLRAISSPTFSVNSLRKVFPAVHDSIQIMLKMLDKHVQSKSHDVGINIHQYYQELTMDVICRISLGQEESEQFRNPYLDTVKRIFGRPANDPIFVSILMAPAWLKWIIRTIAMATARLRGHPLQKLSDQLKAFVKDRREKKMSTTNGNAGSQHTKTGPVDYVDLFLDAEADPAELQSLDSKIITRKMTVNEIAAACLIFLLAGFDTTANSLAIVTWLLAKHDHVRLKVQEEIDSVCDSEDITYEQLQKLTYLDLVLKESLRLNPIVAFACSRTCTAPTKLGDIAIEVGTKILADPWTVHYSTELWGPDAEVFRPERWQSTEARRHPMSWLPFGGGPRICIGLRLAYMEEKLALAHLLRRYDLIAGTDTEVETKKRLLQRSFQESLTLRGSSVLAPVSTTVYLKTRCSSTI